MKYLFAFILSACALPHVTPGSTAPFGASVRLSVWGQFLCSGTIVADEHVLTAAHCMGWPGIKVEGRTVTRAVYPWAPADAVLLTVPGLRPVTDVLWGETPHADDIGIVTGWGCSHGRELGVRVSRVEQVESEGGVYDTEVCPGDSGGGVYDADGALVGLVRAQYLGSPHSAITWLGVPVMVP